MAAVVLTWRKRAEKILPSYKKHWMR
ncbi:hypothetical protein HP435_10050 [Brevibacillus sp. HD3.3A]|nr:hypothetical protein HP435_10050 [Brevibacillus sp. HD3.3A]